MNPRKTVTAIIVGLACACIVWICQPLNNFLLNNSYIADDYLPVLGLALVGLLAVVLGPLLQRWWPGVGLDTRQLALVLAIVLVACSLNEFMRTFPHSLARGNRDLALDKNLADLYAEMRLPRRLFIDPAKFGEDTPASTQLVNELDPGKSIPWRAWFNPLLGWGAMIICCWLIMVGLALVVFPQWRDNERLPFPLLTVYRSLIEPPPQGGRLPAIFRSRIFWLGFGVVALIHAFNGLNHHTNQSFPPFQLGWSLWDTLTEGMWRHVSWYVKSSKILFIIIGITYFVPNRVAFSLWFTVLVYQVYRMVGYEYLAPFHAGSVVDQRFGATFGVGLVILWLGRSQWLATAKALFGRGGGEEGHRDRTAGFLLLVGCLGLAAWHLWAGNALHWALLSVFMVFLTSLVLARIVAETGIPFLANYLGAGHLLALMPIRWLTPTAVYLCNMVDMMIRQGTSRVCATVTCLHGLGIDRELKPRQHARMAKGFVAILLLGLLVCGSVHLWMGYHYSGSLDGARTPIASWGSHYIVWTVENPLKAFGRGSWANPPYSKTGHMIFGFFLGLGLEIACLLSPAWPLHPAGLLLVDTWFLGRAWPSFFLGWAAKRAIVVYGGAQVYRGLRPLFLGLILGEAFSAMLWAVVPVVLIALGNDPADVGHIVIIPQ